MVCVLTQDQLDKLFQKVVKDLLTLSEQGKPFVMKNYILSLYNKVNEKTGNQALAQTYAALVPSKVSLARAVSKTVKDLISPAQVGEIAQVEADFEDFDKVGAYLGVQPKPEIVVSTPEKTEEQTFGFKPINGIINKFSGRPNTVWATTGFEENPELAFSFGFTRKLGSQTDTTSESSGYYLTAAKGSSVLRKGVETSDEQILDSVVSVVTDSEGNTLYFDENYNLTAKENGKAVFYIIREENNQLQSIPEIAATKNITEEQAQKLINKEKNYIKLLKSYILSGGTNKIINRISGVSNGFLDIKYNNPIALKDYASQLSGYSVSVVKETTGAITNTRAYLKTRNERDPFIEIKLNKVETLGEFLDDSVKIILGINTTDTSGNKGKAEVALRQKFLKVYYGNSSIRINESGLVYRVTKEEGKQKWTPLTTEEEVRDALVSYTNNKGKAVPSSINIYQEYSKGVTSFNKTKDGYELFDDSSADKYLNFIIANSFTYSQPNLQGNFNPLHPYLMFEPTLETKDLIKDFKEKGLPQTPTTEIPVTEATVSEKKAETEGKKEKKKFEKKQVTKKEELTDDEIKESIRKKLNKLNTQRDPSEQITEEQVMAAKKWYENHPISKFVPFMAMFDAVNTENPKSVATWTEAGITLFKGSNFTDLYHEAFHAFSQMFMSAKERQKVYNDVRNKSGSFDSYTGKRVAFKNATDLEVEEYLAEEFRKYMLSDGTKSTPKTPITRSFFEKLLDILKALFNIRVEEGIVNYEASSSLNELFNKLKVGNINSVPYGYENRQFDKLDKITAVNPDLQAELDELSYSLQIDLVESIDSIFSEIADEYNSQESSGLKYTSSIVTDPKQRAAIYNKAYNKLVERHQAIENDLETLDSDDPSYNDLITQYNALSAVLNNFSTSESDTITADDIFAAQKDGKGFIAYHMQQSKYLSFEDKFDTLYDAEESSKNSKGEYNKNSGNEVSARDLASKDVHYLIRSLFKYDSKGQVEKNFFGFNKLEDFDIAWNRIQNLLEGTRTADEIYSRLFNAASLRKDSKARMFNQLLSKMGKPNNFSNEETPYLPQINLWTNFTNAFTLKRIPLTQVTIKINEITVNDQSGSQKKRKKITITTGAASSETENIKRKWDNKFTDPSGDTTFIQRVTPGTTVAGTSRSQSSFLKTNKVLTDFSGGIHQADPIRFLHAVGMDVSEHPTIIRALKSSKSEIGNFVDLVYDRLKYFSAAGIFINRPSDIIEIAVEGSTLTGLYKKLLTLERKFSDVYGSDMVSNARNDAQFELSLRSTVSNMIDNLNNVNNYHELFEVDENGVAKYPEMFFLDARRNPMVKSLLILEKLFGENFWMEGKGNKQTDETIGTAGKFRSLSLLNSSGVSLTEDDNHLLGVSSNEADEITSILQNFYSFVQYGVSEGTRHSDKSSTFLYKLNGGGTYYIPLSRFALNDDGFNAGVSRMVKYLTGEVEKIYRLQNGDEAGNALVGDSTYKEIGSKLVAFEDILSAETRKKVMANISDNFEEVLAKKTSLREAIQKDIANYLLTQINNFKEDFASTGAANNSDMMQVLRERVMLDNSSIKLSNEEKDKALFDGYVINDFIHKFETTVMFYGDVAIYNHFKEEFHKRNAGVAATGTIPRTDESMLSLLNGYYKDKYVDSEMFKKMEEQGYVLTEYAKNRKRGRTMNSAIMEDPKLKSVYFDEYVKIAKEREKDRLGRKLTKEEEERVEKAFKEYSSMKVGDAQGYITFDAYRALLLSLGKWSQYQEGMYNKIIAGEDISSVEVAQFFPVKKMQYWGPLATESGLPLMAFHKFSLMPLIPSLIKGSQLEKLHNKMVSQGIDYATFVSGSKINTVTKNGKADKFYNEKTDPSSGVAFEKPDYTFTRNEIFLDYFKDQLEIADTYKGSVIFSTQLRKLIEEGLYENGKPRSYKGTKEQFDALSEKEKLKYTEYAKVMNYEKLVSKYTNYKIKELLKETDITYDPATDTYKLNEKLINFVRKELTRQDLAEHEIDFIKYDAAANNLIYDLSIHPSAEKIEKLLSTLIYKRLIRQKVKGEALIQVSGAGFEASGLRSATAEEIERYGTNGLSFYKPDIINFNDKYKGYKKSALQDAYNTLKSKQPASTYWTDRYRNALTTELAYLDAKIKGLKPEITEIVNPTSAMQVKIALQGDFKKLLKDPEVIAMAKARGISNLDALNLVIKDEAWLAKNKQMITIAGVRIPVQGLNSMEFMQIAEFLPENAGNMVILPAEIVAKSGSDFDIDKLSLMFPSLLKTSKGVSMVKHNSSLDIDTDAVKNQIKELYLKLSDANKDVLEYSKNYLNSIPQELKTDFYETIRAYKDEIRRIDNEIMNQFESGELYPKDLYDELYNIQEELNDLYIAAAEPLREYKKEKVGTIIDEIDELKTQLAEASSDGIENELLAAVVDILSMPENIIDLITPNDTNLVKPLADDLAKDVRDYNPMNTLNNEGKVYKEGGKERISATRIFELRYNRYKQSSNNIGKKTLGMGAVDNTYNTIFNRVGAYMSASVTLGSNPKTQYTVKQVIRGLDHNTMEVGDKEVISLSNLYDKKGENRISNVIAQMMNGWVDVAKDSWIFDIQGNPELSSTLLFMIQAGVPVDQAVYFVSQPVIRDYVKEQRRIRSVFSKPLGVPSAGTNMFRVEARRSLLSQLFPEDRYGVDAKGNTVDNFDNYKQKRHIYKTLVPKYLENKPIDFSTTTLRSNVKEKKYTEVDQQAFLHFIELEEMAKATTALKLTLNFDTSKQSSLYEIREKQEDLRNLIEERRMPLDIVEGILLNSPIGSFNTSREVLGVVRSMFPTRDNETFQKFLRSEFSEFYDDDVKEQYGKSFRTKQDLISAFINDFTSFAFQQFLKDPGRFNPQDPYKGLNVEMDVKKVKQFATGAYVDNGTLYIDLEQLNRDFRLKSFTKPSYLNSRERAVVSQTYFDNANEFVSRNDYFKFIYERETLRNAIPFEEYSKTADFGYRVDELTINKPMTSLPLEQVAYEEFLRDNALFNTLNINFMFKDVNGYANQLMKLVKMHPELGNYSIMNSLHAVGKNGTFNLKISELKLDAKQQSIYHEQLKALADPSVQKVSNNLDNAIISKMFALLPAFNFIQSGQSTKGQFSLAGIVDNTQLAKVQAASLTWLSEKLNSEAAQPLLKNYKTLFDAMYKSPSKENLEDGVEDMDDMFRSKGKIKEYQNLPDLKIAGKKFISRAGYDPSISVYNEKVNPNDTPEIFEKRILELLGVGKKSEPVPTETAGKIYAKLGNKTQSENVEIPGIGDLKDVKYDSKTFWSEVVPEAKAWFGDKLVIAYRGKRTNTFLQNYKGRLSGDPALTIGNPFDWQDETGTRDEKGIKSTLKFIHWMITGDNMGVADATPEYRQAIIDDIKNGELKNRPIIYYQEKGYATHATALDYLINKYDWSGSSTQPSVAEESVAEDVTDTVLVFDNAIELYSKENQARSGEKFSNTYIKDLVAKKVISKANVSGITTKKRSTPILNEDFLTDDTYESNVRTIEENIQKLVELQNKGKGKKLIFSADGYGQDLIKKSGETLYAPETFVYLSKRLFEEFGYINPGYKKVASTIDSGKALKEQILSAEPITDEQVREKQRECFKSLLRL